VRLWTLAIGVLAASGLAALAPPAAGAAEPTAAGVHRYEVDLARLPGATVSVQQGVRQAGGACRFSGGGHGRPSGSGKVRYVTEVSFDPATCSRQLATADYPRSAVPASVRAKLVSARRTTATAGKPTRTAGPTTAAAGSWSGGLQVNVEDPVQINVTSTRSTLAWSYDGTTLAATHGAEWGWFTPSGWQRRAYRWTPANTGTVASTDTYGMYRNGVFCFTIDTWTEHRKTLFEGRPDGSWAWSYEVDKWGGCNSLLHYEYLVETP
jgi:hypothetical protein